MPQMINENAPMFIDLLNRCPDADPEDVLRNLKAVHIHAVAFDHAFTVDARNIDEGFSWGDSPQGHEYWSALYQGELP